MQEIKYYKGIVMTTYERIFGTGPRGLLISILFMVAAAFIEESYINLQITESDVFRYTVFSCLTFITVFIIIWSIKSLPPLSRGNILITTGAFKYFRHPLYGATLSFFNFGLAFVLNNWVYIFWAIIQHPMWHWNINSEKILIRSAFPKEYDEYCKNTGRFFPRFLFNNKGK